MDGSGEPGAEDDDDGDGDEEWKSYTLIKR